MRAGDELKPWFHNKPKLQTRRRLLPIQPGWHGNHEYWHCERAFSCQHPGQDLAHHHYKQARMEISLACRVHLLLKVLLPLGPSEVRVDLCKRNVDDCIGTRPGRLKNCCDLHDICLVFKVQYSIDRDHHQAAQTGTLCR